MTVPTYYTTLAPFRELFLSGLPVLTYHHVARRRRGARIKGLYVSPALFRRQLGELTAAGFSTSRLETIAGTAPQPKACWLTFDDGFTDVFLNALPCLSRHGFTSIQFLVAGLLGHSNDWQQRRGDVAERLMDKEQIKEWLAAGQEIGSHTQTHPHLTQIPLDEAREQIGASKKALEDTFGMPVIHFCYPYGDWNPRIRDLVADAGYQTACTTDSGINHAGDSPFELRRFTARYTSRTFKNLLPLLLPSYWYSWLGAGRRHTK